MRAFALWPFITLLKRIASALEEANRLEKYRQELEFKPLPQSTVDPKVRKAVISHAKYATP